MTGDTRVEVLRLGHRPGRDDRMTTHVGLTARALGADAVVFGPEAGHAAETVRDITDRFGGPFAVERSESPTRYLSEWKGSIVHLTMYGLPIQSEIDAIRERSGTEHPLLVAVGAEKVPFDVYEQADWNVAVTNQPHSEVASLAVFLDRLYEGAELEADWPDADREVLPEARGKTVVDAAESDPGPE